MAVRDGFARLRPLLLTGNETPAQRRATVAVAEALVPFERVNWLDRTETLIAAVRDAATRAARLGRTDRETWRAHAAAAIAGLDREPTEHAALLALLDVGSAQSRPMLVHLAEVEPVEVRWLWAGRIPLGKITVLDGDPGLGKSLVTLDVAARVTRGSAMPDGTPCGCGVGGVVLLSAEDDLADTIRPRLDAASADTSRIAALQMVAREGGVRLPSLADVEAIESAIETRGARLVVVDPLMAYLPGQTDSHRDQDVRAVLAPLAHLAARRGVAIVIVRHLNKSGGGNPLYRGGGSIGIVGAARSGLLVARDPDDATGTLRVFAVTKSNLAAPVSAIAYRIEVSGNVARVAWEGETTHTAEQLVATPRTEEERGALDEAKDFLREILGGGPVPSKDVQRQARDAGIADRTLDRARRGIGVRAVHRGRPGTSQVWEWELAAGEVDL